MVFEKRLGFDPQRHCLVISRRAAEHIRESVGLTTVEAIKSVVCGAASDMHTVNRSVGPRGECVIQTQGVAWARRCRMAFNVTDRRSRCGRLRVCYLVAVDFSGRW